MVWAKSTIRILISPLLLVEVLEGWEEEVPLALAVGLEGLVAEVELEG